MATIAGRSTSESGTHVVDQVQEVNAGSTDSPKTSVSTMAMESTAQAARPACAGVTAG
jgi:hypothetical protein